MEPMRTIRIFLLSGAIIGLTAVRCAGPALSLMPGYAKADFRDAIIGVILVKKNITIGNPEELSAVFGGGDALGRYGDFFGDSFPPILKALTRFRQVDYLKGADENMRQSVEGINASGGGSGACTVPSRRNYIDAKYRYLLIVDFCTIGREQNTGVPSLGNEANFTGFGAGLDFAKFSAMFVVWDNAKASLASYGKVEEKIATGGEYTKATLVELMRAAASSIARGMPYRR
jgi:hypothetical protein